jgi:hypothetical protein
LIRCLECLLTVDLERAMKTAHKPPHKLATRISDADKTSISTCNSALLHSCKCFEGSKKVIKGI